MDEEITRFIHACAVMWARKKSKGTYLAGLCDFAILLSGFIIIVCTRHVLWGDGAVRFFALNQLLLRGTIRPIAYSLLGPLFASPLWIMGRSFDQSALFVSYFNTLLFFGSMITSYVALHDRIDRRVLRMFFIILLFGSMFPFHLLYFYGEVATSIAAAAGLALIVAGRSGWGWAGMLFGLINTPGTIVGFVLTGLRRMVRTRRFRILLVFLLGAVLLCVANTIQRGSFLRTGYENNHGGHNALLPLSDAVGLGYPFLFGFLSEVFSFGKGIIFFAPGLLLPIRSSLRALGEKIEETYVLWMLYVLGLILLYAKWWDWSGDAFWGPRFLLFASIPASFALAVHIVRPRTKSLLLDVFCLGALLLSFWVGLNGLIFDLGPARICSENGFSLQMICWYAPEFSTLWRPFAESVRVSSYEILIMVLWASVFAYVARGLIARIIRALMPEVRRLRKTYLRFHAWRF